MAVPQHPSTAARVMLVARCGGHRCAALVRPRADADDLVAAALRRRKDGVLMRTGCLGCCHVGAVAAVGWAHADGKHLSWERPPGFWGQVDTDDAARSLAAWLEHGCEGPPARTT